ncbi:RNA-directed DNA polymerase, eukaryota [Tanacetum coccineum]
MSLHKLAPMRFTPNVEENVLDNIPGNASQPKPNPTTSGNKEKASSVNDKFQASGSILEVMDELIKIVEPSLVKNEFLKHFTTRFAAPSSSSITFDYQFPNQLTPDQIEDLERNVSYEEIKRAVWDCGLSKSPGLDSSFPPGCTSSFITLIPKSQGDPLSPFLFILIMESLHLSFNNMVNVGLYNGIQIDESLNLSHLFYADDVIFVGKWNSSNLSIIVNVLKWFYLALGLKINLNKSKLMGIGISHDVVASVAKSIGCSILHTPFNYLGVKVGGIMSRLSSWDDVIAKLSAILSKWKLKSLSIGGCLTLIKSVLSSLPLYYMSSFKVPKGVLSKLESIHRNFFNAIYGIHGALNNSSSYSRRSPWLDIVNEVRKLASKGIDLLSLAKKKVGNGEATSFWNDVWLDPSGDFSVKLTREFIDDSMLPKMDVPTRWVKSIPIKINIFAWRVSLDKLPTRLNLSLRGLDIPSIICPLCSIAVESTSHLLFSCQLARQLMIKVVHWWELEYQDFHSYEDWLLWFKNLRVSKRLKDVFEGVCYISWWVIWKFRNQVLFGINFPRLDLLFDDIVRLSFHWCSSRCSSNFDWNTWMKNPSSIIL